MSSMFTPLFSFLMFTLLSWPHVAFSIYVPDASWDIQEECPPTPLPHPKGSLKILSNQHQISPLLSWATLTRSFGQPWAGRSQEAGWAVWVKLGKEKTSSLCMKHHKWVFSIMQTQIPDKIVTRKRNLPVNRALKSGQAHISEKSRKMAANCSKAQAFTDHNRLRTVFLSLLSLMGYNSPEQKLCSLVQLGKVSGDSQSRKCSFLSMQWFLQL